MGYGLDSSQDSYLGFGIDPPIDISLSLFISFFPFPLLPSPLSNITKIIKHILEGGLTKEKDEVPAQIR